MGPFIQSKESVKKNIIHIMIALLPIMAFMIYKNGYLPYSNGDENVISIFNPLLFMLIGSFTSFLVETGYYLFKKQNRKILSSYSFLPGLFLSLLLPFNTPIYILIIGCVISSIFGKLVFCGFGKSLINPTLVGYAVIIIFFRGILTLDNYAVDIQWQETLLYLLAFIYLTITRTIKWKIPVFYIGTVFLTKMMIGRILGQDIFNSIFHIMSGNLLFGAIFLATDSSTSCVTTVGQILQGIMLGILTVMIQSISIEAGILSILIVNFMVSFFDQIGAKSRFDLSKAILPFAIMAILMMGTAIGIALINHSKVENSNLMTGKINLDIQNLVRKV